MNAFRVSANYADLLNRIPPKVIRTDEENQQYIEALYELEQRSDSLTPEEKELSDLLSLIIEDFEERRYPLRHTSPAEMVGFLMEQHGLETADLAGILSSPADVVAGRQELTTEEIRRLSDRFHVSPEVFF